MHLSRSLAPFAPPFPCCVRSDFKGAALSRPRASGEQRPCPFAARKPTETRAGDSRTLLPSCPHP
eukprot:797688-Rhodomonas_salina.2